jgi:hypothetical protein
VRTEIATGAEAVWAAVADVTRMGEWSPECTGARWRGSPAAPVPGARFSGHNRKGLARWSTACEVVEAEPGRVFAWEVSFGVPIARWTYRFTPTADGHGTVVEQSWLDRRSRLVAWLTETVLGTGRRGDWNEVTMTATLAALKRALEAERPAGRP